MSDALFCACRFTPLLISDGRRRAPGRSRGLTGPWRAGGARGNSSDVAVGMGSWDKPEDDAYKVTPFLQARLQSLGSEAESATEQQSFPDESG